MSSKQFKEVLPVSRFANHLSSVGASVTWEPYLGFSKGNTEIEGKTSPSYELALGTALGSRATIESFLMIQPLSPFPHVH